MLLRNKLPEFLFLATTLAGLHILPATSELYGGTSTPGPYHRVVLLGDSRPRRFPFAYGDRIRFPILNGLVLVYQRYQNLALLEAVRLAGALQRCGCHFITGMSVRLFCSRDVLLMLILCLIQIGLSQYLTYFLSNSSFRSGLHSERF